MTKTYKIDLQTQKQGYIITKYMTSERKLSATMRGVRSELTHFALTEEDMNEIFRIRTAVNYLLEIHTLKVELFPRSFHYIVDASHLNFVLEELERLKRRYEDTIADIGKKVLDKAYDADLRTIASQLREDANSEEDRETRKRLYRKADRLVKLADTIATGFKKQYQFDYDYTPLRDVLERPDSGFEVISDKNLRETLKQKAEEQKKKVIAGISGELNSVIIETLEIIENGLKTKGDTLSKRYVEAVDKRIDKLRMLNIFNDKYIKKDINRLEKLVSQQKDLIGIRLKKIKKAVGERTRILSRRRIELVD